jgi:hypothetical protein
MKDNSSKKMSTDEMFDFGCFGVLILAAIFYFFYLSGWRSWVVSWFLVYWAFKNAKFIHGDD